MEPPAFLMLQTLISLSLFSFVSNQVCNDKSYTLISEPRRSAQAVYESTIDIAICDHGIDEGIWFRFDSYTGDAIVEREASTPIPMLRCGTDGPIYIRGLNSHPVNDYEGTTATVCANYAGNTCYWNAAIQIYRCPGYYLYKLKSPPECSISYCVGDKPPCARGDYWNGFTCVNYFPVMAGVPIFSGPFVNGSGSSEEIYFRCQVQYNRQANDLNARFRVTFLFDGQPLEYIGIGATFPPARLQPTTLNPDSNLVAVLDEIHLRGRLGKEISCQAVSYWEGNSQPNSSMRSVATFYAAFESTVQSYSISLTSGSTFNVTFRSTLPLTCHHCINPVDPNCCRYRFRMVNYTASSAQCFLYWTGGDSAVVTVYFVPGATKSHRYFALAFEKYNDDVTAPTLSLWHDYVIPPVPMTIVPELKPFRRCLSHDDPHLQTFDGRNFNNYRVGDFYLVRAINDKQSMEIQTRHEICLGAATCNCGVVVREGNSVLKIASCGAGPWTPTTQRSPRIVRLLSQDPPDSSTVYIDGTGLIYSIRMPSGLRVNVDVHKPWFNIYVLLPPEYVGKTDSNSMCGNCDGNRFNDHNTNMTRFRIPKELSYFRTQPACSTIFNTVATKCGCNTTYPKCSNKDPTLWGTSRPDKPFAGRWKSKLVCSHTPVAAMPSSLDDSSNADNDFILDDDILFPPYTYDPDFGANVSFAWPTPKNKTQQEVEQHCANVLQSSPAYADCSANVDMATIIDMCASDIQIADDWISVSAYIFTFEQECLNNIAETINSSDASNSNETFDSLTSVSRKICPNQCSGHGTCSEATCICNTGYIGADCSIDQALPPSLTDISRGGACDVRKRPCDVISVYGSGVAFSSALKCRFADQSTGGEGVTDGTFITALEYSCPVPETTTHRRRRSASTRTTALSTRKVSITVDGVLYSNILDFVLFDSVCMECNSSDTCRQTDNGCLISDECVADKAVNPDDSCFQCDTSVNRNSWKDITVVENWKPCTRNCDVGVATRNKVCGSRIVDEETDFCEVQNCPDNAEEKAKGFGITLSSEDLKLILIDPVASLVPFATALNQYCSENAAACCNSIGIPTRGSDVTYTSPDLLTYASGYPVINSTDTSLKIIAKIDRAKLGAECSGTQTQGSNIVYADQKLIFDAVTSEKSAIEQALSITIVSVWSSDGLHSSTPRADTSVSIIYNLIGFWVFVILAWNNHA